MAHLRSGGRFQYQQRAGGQQARLSRYQSAQHYHRVEQGCVRAVLGLCELLSSVVAGFGLGWPTPPVA